MYDILRKSIASKVSVTDEEWNTILEKTESISVKKNSFFQIQDTTSRYEGFVLKGAFKIYTIDENGSENILFFSFEGDWICDIESFYYKKNSQYNVKAIEDSELAIISRANKSYLFKIVPKMLEFHTIMLERANIVMQKRLLDVLHKNAIQRYLDFVKRYPTKYRVINNKNLSSYLGVSQEFLSKIKKTIAQQEKDFQK